ncbi:hypothetical protein VTP01DRAFT_2810 [Rhizomucor pusillus]|uniref:uncharacterized protein n=1 Tax=Rhizomucor pusillus TaxID=4840 RepID=UPI003742C4CE
MESHTLELYPDRGQVHIALFRNVTNAADLRKRLIAQDSTLSCALVEASVVIDTFHVLLAVIRAVHDEQHNRLKSHNINSEIVIDFSPATNIAQALRRFGISDESQNILVVKVGGDASEVENYMRENIKGDLVSLSQLSETLDLKLLAKYYSLGEQGKSVETALPLVASSMALKGYN